MATMSELTVSELKALLGEAETALHTLMTGRQAVSVSDGEGHAMTYSAATRSDLQAYIANLKALIAQKGDTTIGRRRSALRAMF